MSVESGIGIDVEDNEDEVDFERVWNEGEEGYDPRRYVTATGYMSVQLRHVMGTYSFTPISHVIIIYIHFMNTLMPLLIMYLNLPHSRSFIHHLIFLA